MNQFMLEVVDHKNGNIIGSDKGTAYYLSLILRTVLENMTDDCGITINKIYPSSSRRTVSSRN
uniref:Uncharacterized protein n=1 Tax=viral metagenome TaxID=1070528 RepID=A0A6H1ZNN9_9ZZZZ